MIPDQQTNSSELNAYTWYDCSLSELTSLVERVRAHTTDGCELRYYRVHPDYDGSYARKYIGSVIVGEARNTDAATLAELGFHIGDYISVAVGSDTDDRARAPRDDERVKVTITNSRR